MAIPDLTLLPQAAQRPVAGERGDGQEEQPAGGPYLFDPPSDDLHPGEAKGTLAI